MQLTEGIKQWIATTAWEFEQDKMLVYLAQQLGHASPDRYGHNVHPSDKALGNKKEFGKWDSEGYDRTFKRIDSNSYEVKNDGFSAPVKIEKIENNIYVNGFKMSADTTVEQVGKKLISLLGVQNVDKDPITNINILLKSNLGRIAFTAFDKKYSPLTLRWGSNNTLEVSTRVNFSNTNEVSIPYVSTPTKFLIGTTPVTTLDPETVIDIIKAEYDKISQTNEFSGRAFGDLKKKFPDITKVSTTSSNVTLYLSFDLSDEYSTLGLLSYWMVRRGKSAIGIINKILKNYNKTVDYIGRMNFEKGLGTISLGVISGTSSISGINKIYDDWKTSDPDAYGQWNFRLQQAIVKIFQ